MPSKCEDVVRWDRASLQKLLRSNDRAVLKALYWVNRNQTESERNMNRTLTVNGKGFSKYDAPHMMDLARRAARTSLTPNQMRVACKVMPKYWKQLLDPIQVKNEGRVVKRGKTFIEVRRRHAA